MLRRAHYLRRESRRDDDRATTCPSDSQGVADHAASKGKASPTYRDGGYDLYDDIVRGAGRCAVWYGETVGDRLSNLVRRVEGGEGKARLSVIVHICVRRIGY